MFGVKKDLVGHFLPLTTPLLTIILFVGFLFL